MDIKKSTKEVIVEDEKEVKQILGLNSSEPFPECKCRKPVEAKSLSHLFVEEKGWVYNSYRDEIKIPHPSLNNLTFKNSKYLTVVDEKGNKLIWPDSYDSVKTNRVNYFEYKGEIIFFYDTTVLLDFLPMNPIDFIFGFGSTIFFKIENGKLVKITTVPKISGGAFNIHNGLIVTGIKLTELDYQTVINIESKFSYIINNGRVCYCHPNGLLEYHNSYDRQYTYRDPKTGKYIQGGRNYVTHTKKHLVEQFGKKYNVITLDSEPV
jgi:hypothetical protein